MKICLLLWRYENGKIEKKELKEINGLVFITSG